MADLATIRHTTRYRYDRPVAIGPQTIRLRPAPRTRSNVVSAGLAVGPAEHRISWFDDPHGNQVARVVFLDDVPGFTIDVSVVVDLTPINPFDFLLEPEAATWPFAYDAGQAGELSAFLSLDPATPALAAFLASLSRDPRSTVDLLAEINSRLAATIEYRTRLEPGIRAPEETLRLGEGSCRDTSWLCVQILRHLGLAARFVSGYLVQPEETDASAGGDPAPLRADLHAWAETYLPGAGWIGLDATSGLLTAEGHIPLAAAVHPAAAAPVSGTIGRAKADFEVSMTARRLPPSQFQSSLQSGGMATQGMGEGPFPALFQGQGQSGFD